jgi:hypothetical protein
VQLAVQPCLRECPLAPDGRSRDSDDSGRFLGREPPKATQLDDSALTRVDPGQARQRIVECHHIDVPDAGLVDHLAERERYMRAAALRGVAAASVVDENTPHQLRRDCEEVRPILPAYLALIDDAHVDLMDQRGCLEGVPAAFLAQITAGEPSQLGIDDWKEPIQRIAIAFAPVEE